MFVCFRVTQERRPTCPEDYTGSCIALCRTRCRCCPGATAENMLQNVQKIMSNQAEITTLSFCFKVLVCSSAVFMGSIVELRPQPSLHLYMSNPNSFRTVWWFHSKRVMSHQVLIGLLGSNSWTFLRGCSVSGSQCILVSGFVLQQNRGNYCRQDDEDFGNSCELLRPCKLFSPVSKGINL